MAVAETTVHPFHAALVARDVPAMVETMTPDVVLRSPITSRLRFEGREQVSELIQLVVFDSFDEVRFTDELASGDSVALVFQARIGSQEIEGVDVLRLAEDGRVREFTVFIRPLPGLALTTQAIGTRLGARRGRARGVLLRLMVAPLVWLIRAGDRVGVRLVRPQGPGR